ncbi:ribokinase [Parashewanella spongiae]|uniref:Ribokinase n=1 Tax=Parashewanella spongiae TaxID=342950 RepID=A0A3A6U1E6_9GAMM|nr:PfkB family carbohydrate kinase [Parashewanella spongiae]MCL1076861.1 PfkB family carbohydrate kinase [Parashewanella spongiae]RJY19228.1 ribokinase [Parashewanella spongiae]
MAKILLVANLNCDRVLHLDKPIQLGGRFHYQDGHKRLGGGGANTGIGLAFAHHQVSLVSEVGQDPLGDWLINEATDKGIDCTFVKRRTEPTQDLMLLITPEGERTIIRPHRPTLELGIPHCWEYWDALYLNTSAQGATSWSKTALSKTLVVAQLGKDNRERPCHVLISSEADMLDRSHLNGWEFGLKIAGESLQYFIVTNGEHGATLYTSEQQITVSVRKTAVVDSTGAGDAYAAGLIHGLVTRMTITEAMKEAAQWASCAVTSASSIPDMNLKRYLSLVK